MGRGCRAAVFCILVVLLNHCCVTESDPDQNDQVGSWEMLLSNSGVSAMHMALMRNNKVVIFDRSDYGPSNISLPGGRCRLDPHDQALKNDCWAHSIEYDIALNKVRPLMILTDTWCSAGGMDRDGRLIQTGGYNDGERVVRVFDTCEGCDWEEFSGALAVRRWYSTDAVLPDGRFIVIGGRKQFNYEFVPKNPDDKPISFPFLAETTDPSENNLYPFVNLLPDGNLFVFANTRSILLNYNNNTVLREYPPMPGGVARSYPATGSSVLLPLDGNLGYADVSVLICGGAKANAFALANKGTFLPAATSCGRLRVSDPDPQWEMEEMPAPRVMADMLLLPTGDVLLINGAKNGTAGWFLGRNPALHPLVYRPKWAPSQRFLRLAKAHIPRMYHSTAHLLPDGRILVGGSNPNVFYNFQDVLFPTELSLEAFSPPYLAPQFASRRPNISFYENNIMSYGSSFLVEFSIQESDPIVEDRISVSLIAPSFTTHSYSMNQRMLKLSISQFVIFPFSCQVTVATPPSKNLAPPGYYLLFVLYKGIPSSAIWVQLAQ
ncbi:hypothetical protein SUGI_0262090 [Cryptomeria japonica]|uniref:aldehyde oxidase GLOX-like n=1 Tax=Cryptomeria japonica TaxID=3369 RepID=UPI002408E0D9|nr:aldehyde oxidase GLOX-like [Cryptomeria japonica]GLJ15874.1 hypothetical protein SUGI_0262090 [Cryptomeria japonica]